jgi:hypothetical protein
VSGVRGKDEKAEKREGERIRSWEGGRKQE